MSKKKGRKSKLTPELRRRICIMLSRGHTIKTVCEAVGIAERTYYDWQKHPHFSQATTCAIGQSKIFLVEKLRQSKDWRATAFLLERRWPEEYGRVTERPIPVDPSQPVAPIECRIIIKNEDGTELPLFATEGETAKPKLPPTGGNGIFEFTRS